ncbi:Venom allergen 3, partial [Armadillidium vulgare]
MAPSAWFLKEKDFYDPADIPKFKADTNSLGKSNTDHGHFTQMIWWNVRRMGCAKIGFKSSKPDAESQSIVTCHYGPTGNLMDSTIYEKGEPCTKCSGQGRTCSTKYKGLCG